MKTPTQNHPLHHIILIPPYFHPQHPLPSPSTSPTTFSLSTHSPSYRPHQSPHLTASLTHPSVTKQLSSPHTLNTLLSMHPTTSSYFTTIYIHSLPTPLTNTLPSHPLYRGLAPFFGRVVGCIHCDLSYRVFPTLLPTVQNDMYVQLVPAVLVKIWHA